MAEGPLKGESTDVHTCPNCQRGLKEHVFLGGPYHGNTVLIEESDDLRVMELAVPDGPWAEAFINAGFPVQSHYLQRAEDAAFVHVTQMLSPAEDPA